MADDDSDKCLAFYLVSFKIEIPGAHIMFWHKLCSMLSRSFKPTEWGGQLGQPGSNQTCRETKEGMTDSVVGVGKG